MIAAGIWITLNKKKPSVTFTLLRRSQLCSKSLEKDFIFIIIVCLVFFPYHYYYNPTWAMNGVRKHFVVGLLLLTCALTSRCSESASTATTAAAAASAGRDATMILRRLVEIVRNVEESRNHLSAKTETPLMSRAWTSPTEPKDLRSMKTDRRVKAAGEWRLWHEREHPDG